VQREGLLVGGLRAGVVAGTLEDPGTGGEVRGGERGVVGPRVRETGMMARQGGVVGLVTGGAREERALEGGERRIVSWIVAERAEQGRERLVGERATRSSARSSSPATAASASSASRRRFGSTSASRRARAAARLERSASAAASNAATARPVSPSASAARPSSSNSCARASGSFSEAMRRSRSSSNDTRGEGASTVRAYRPAPSNGVHEGRRL
jgi:hypothetical protein